MPQELCALDLYLSQVREVAIVGEPADPATRGLIGQVHDRYLPNAVVAAAAPRTRWPSAPSGCWPTGWRSTARPPPTCARSRAGSRSPTPPSWPPSSPDARPSEILTLADVEDAAARLEGIAHRTPVLTSRTLDEIVGGHVFLKAECFQRGGAFKFRGAFNRMSRLSRGELDRGVVAYSSGNHAQAVALAASLP